MSYIIERLCRHAQQQSDIIAISTDNSTVTYGNLYQQVETLATELRSAKYHCIGLLADNSINWAIIDLACLQAGICCIPIPHFFSRKQILHVCQSAGIQALIGDADQIDACVIGIQPNRYHGELDMVICDLLSQHSSVANDTGSLAKITFTSGSTGTPKGVCLGHQQIENTVKSLDQVIPAGTSHRHLSVLPLVTLLENIAGLYLSLVQGAQIMLYPMARIGFKGLASLDQQTFFHRLNESRPQSLILVPELLRLLIYGVHHRTVDASQFKFIAVGGGTVSENLLLQAAALGLPVVQGYGLSECASVVSLNTLNNNHIGSVGRPLQYLMVKIAEDGEIYITGNNMSGYLGESRFTDDWFATGDIGYLDAQGYLYVTGRKKNMLVTSFGKNISPEWVESVFLQSPMIRQVLITGEASTHLRAIIVPASTALNETLDCVIDEINSQLPDYAKVREYRLAAPFCYHNGLLTANGRMKRAAITAHYA